MPMPSNRRMLTAFAWFIALSLGYDVSNAQEQLDATQPNRLNATLLDYRILSDIRIDGIKFSEASGASFDHDDQLLRIVSDRARLFSFSVPLSEGRFVAIKPVSGVKLRDTDGTQMRRVGFNPEGLETYNGNNGTTRDANVVVVSETGPSIARFSIDGTLMSFLTVPEAVRNPERQRSVKDGLESLAQHPDFGLLTAPEEPLQGEPRRLHTIYGAEDTMFSFDVSDTGSTSIKSLEILPDGRFLILENVKSDDKTTLTPILRILDPTRCEADVCPTRWAAVPIPGVPDAKFEGVAYIGGGKLIIVSDDKINNVHRTVFGLIGLAEHE